MDPEPGFWDQDLIFFVPEPGFWDQDLVFFWTTIRILGPGSDIFCSENMKFGLKWVHMAQYELILKLDGAL